jgi:hypothetical protein
VQISIDYDAADTGQKRRRNTADKTAAFIKLNAFVGTSVVKTRGYDSKKNLLIKLLAPTAFINL